MCRMMCLVSLLAVCCANTCYGVSEVQRQRTPRTDMKQDVVPEPRNSDASSRIPDRAKVTLADIAAREAELEKKLEELEKREAALIERAQRLTVPVAVPSQQRAFRGITTDRDTRIPQSYYYSGEGHFID